MCSNCAWEAVSSMGIDAPLSRSAMGETCLIVVGIE